MKNKKEAFILWFDELSIKDVPLVGGKTASLGEMYRTLAKKGVAVPYGFAVSAYAYKYLIETTGIEKDIKRILKGLNVHNLKDLQERGGRIRALIRRTEFPEELNKAISKAYKRMCKLYGNNCSVAVRSSATAEDLPGASFAGQQETFLNVTGEHDLIEACKDCFASLFTNRAISYRVDKGFSHFQVYLSIAVQKMVRSDKSCSGVMFSVDTESGFKDVVLINGAWGLGENIVQGAVNPDEFFVFKPTLKGRYNPILSKRLGEKEKKMIYASGGPRPVKNIPTTEKEKKSFVLNDKEIIQLAKWAVVIEEHYSKVHNRWTPMDMEWAKDGVSGKLFIVQARPETVVSQRAKNIVEEYSLTQKGKLLAEGRSIGDKIGLGKARVIKNVKDIHNFKKGEVLVTEMTDPDWEPIMKIASAIVTDHGGRTCHAAIIARELGIPCIVGTENATHSVKTGEKVTVACSEGEVGRIYSGFLKYKIDKIDLKKVPKTKTKIMMNVGTPDRAFELANLPSAGVGLAREEFIISSYIKIHPNALINYNKLTDPHLKEQIDKLTFMYPKEKKKQFYIDRLAEGIALIAAAFYPNDVIVRTSDFKTNEYANLIGGTLYEPHEENPMIGWRGASRYYSPEFRDAFALECKALKKVRDVMGLTNVKVMIPFCRTLGEGKMVVKEMAKNGLKRGQNKLEIYMMCEIPSNVILVEEFAKIFDGFSIGTNDLTQLTLGLDRDSELISHLYDERNTAVKSMVARVVLGAKKARRKIGICGDAPSTYPEFAQFLVKCHIDSISLSPDAVLKTTLKIAEMEKKLKVKA
ncbi:phosphoenolpyruvate synthase [Candidatus Woesearchaeota archaeon]|nr:phosphoenolpyruvate synthase [Candidatus Woesearchaeota archaeon]